MVKRAVGVVTDEQADGLILKANALITSALSG